MSCNVDKTKAKPCWNDMEELKYLICAIESCKCPSVPPSPLCNIILPPRIEEIPCEIPSRRPPPCTPPARCCSVISNSCCSYPMPSLTPPAKLSQPRLPSNCLRCTPLPCYPN